MHSDLLKNQELALKLGYIKNPLQGYKTIILDEGNIVPSKEQFMLLRTSVKDLPYVIMLDGYLLHLDCILDQKLYFRMSLQLVQYVSTLTRSLPSEIRGVIIKASGSTSGQPH